MELSTNQVVAMSGASARMVQWWAEHRIVTPRIHGKLRRYTQWEALEVSIITEVRRRGAPLQSIRRGIGQLRKAMRHHITEEVLQVHPEAELMLTVSGAELWKPERGNLQMKIVEVQFLADALMQSREAHHVINLSEIIRRVHNPVRNHSVLVRRLAC
jgi:DNA-binding transcriptional MerR regulator